MTKVTPMNIADAAQTFLDLYRGIYQNLHPTWDKQEHPPSLELMAVLNHLMLTGPVTVTEAAQHFDRSQSAMSELINRAQAQGCVDRIKDSRDKRRTLVWVTPKGRELHARAQQVLDVTRLQQTLARLSEQQRLALCENLQAFVSAARQTLEHQPKEPPK